LDVRVRPELIFDHVKDSLRIEPLRFESVKSEQLIVIIDLNRVARWQMEVRPCNLASRVFIQIICRSRCNYVA
jgi:hypothetical protein